VLKGIASGGYIALVMTACPHAKRTLGQRKI
jgi:glutathionyl-hydroquinone reductase